MNNRESKLTGFYDVFEEEVEKINHIHNVFVEESEKFGFQQMKIAMVEHRKKYLDATDVHYIKYKNI
ncbi:TPA: hypothetical protein ACKR2O_000156 [Streptococcus pyogenes]